MGHVHTREELERNSKITELLQKAQGDRLALELQRAGYGSPKWLAGKIREAEREHQRYLDSLVAHLQGWARQVLEEAGVPDRPPEETTVRKSADWTSNVVQILMDAGIDGQVIAQTPGLREFIYGKLMVSNAQNTALHFWRAFSKEPRSAEQVAEFFGKTYSTGFKIRASNHATNVTNKMALTDVKAVRQAFRDGLNKGNGVYAVIDNLRDHPSFSAARSRAFAITEVLTSYAEGTQLALEESEEVDGKTWVHTGDHKNKPRPAHVALDGTTIGVEEHFEVNGHPALYPRDRALPVEERVNCHCGIDPYVDLDAFGISEDDLEDMRAEAREEIEGEYTAQELEEMLYQQHQEQNANPLGIGDIRWNTEQPAVAPPTPVAPAIPQVQVTTEGINPEFERYRYDDTGTQVRTEFGNKDGRYDDYIELNGMDAEMEEMAYDHYYYNENVGSANKWMEALEQEGVRDDVVQSMRAYSQSHYTSMNGYLRGTLDNPSPQVLEWNDHLMAAIDKMPTPDNIVVYRGLNLGTGRKLLDGLGEGDILYDGGFGSVSTDAGVARDFAKHDGYLFKLRMPAGTKAAPLRKWAAYHAEMEILLQAGSGLRIDKITKRGEQQIIEATIVQN